MHRVIEKRFLAKKNNNKEDSLYKKFSYVCFDNQEKGFRLKKQGRLSIENLLMLIWI